MFELNGPIAISPAVIRNSMLDQLTLAQVESIFERIPMKRTVSRKK